MATLDQFRITEVVTTIPNASTSLVLTEGTDYSLEVTDSSRVFARVISTRNSSTGPTSGGGTTSPNRVTSTIDQSSILSSVTLTRNNSTSDSRVVVRFYEYIGESGGPDEFIVRATGLVTIGTTVDTADSSIIAGIADIDDALPFITASRSNSAAASDTNGMHVSNEWIVSGGDRIRFKRGSGWGPTDNDTTFVSYAVVEFTGSNWSVRRDVLSHPTSANGSVTTISSIDTSKSFFHYQYNVSQANPGLDDAGVMVEILSDTTLNLDATTTINNTAKEIVLWWVTSTSTFASVNQQLQVTVNGGSEEQVENHTLVSPPNSEFSREIVSVESICCNSTGGGTAHPRGQIAVSLREDPGPSSDVLVTTYQSDNGQTSDIAMTVFIWPAIDRTPIEGESNGVTTCSGNLSIGIELSADSEGVATCSGTLFGMVLIDGQSEGTSSASGTFSALSSIGADSDGVATCSGTLGASVELSADSDGLATASGTLGASVELSADSEGVATCSGTLNALRLIGADSDGLATASGTLGASVELTVSVVGLTSALGTIFSVVFLGGDSEGTSTTSANLTVSGTLQLVEGDSEGTSTTSASLRTVASLAGETGANSSNSGTVEASTKFEGTSVSSSATLGQINAKAELASFVSGLTSATAEVILKAEIEAQSTGRSIVTAELAPMPITGFANGQTGVTGSLLRIQRITASASGTSQVVADSFLLLVRLAGSSQGFAIVRGKFEDSGKFVLVDLEGSVNRSIELSGRVGRTTIHFKGTTNIVDLSGKSLKSIDLNGDVSPLVELTGQIID